MVVTADSVARFAAVLGDRTRTAMCLALLDGRAWTAGELAQQAGVARSTASEQLDHLVAAGFLVEERQGRHRYLRLAGPAVAQVIEDLGAVSGELVQPSSLRSVRAHRELLAARTCYDHVAGAVGVALLDGLLRRGWLRSDDDLALTPAGRAWTGDFLRSSPTGTRPLLRTCLDWTERRHHLGGRLGAALRTELHERGWLLPATRPRALTLTGAGRAGLVDLLGDDPAWGAA